MNTISATTSLVTHAMAWALLYSLWQGLLIYGSLFIVLKALPNINARLKYYLSFGAFLALFLWFADTWMGQYQRLKGITVYITQPGADSVTDTTYPVQAATDGVIHSTFLHNVLNNVEQFFPFMIILYILGLAFMLLRFLVNVLQLRALKTQGILPAGYEWNSMVLQWQRNFDISRPVKLYLSDRINVPMMLGVIKPVILLPVAAINHLSTEQVEAILLHELAHIKRHDYLLNIFQSIAEVVLFFNPFVWLISGIIRREREHCCDDLVVACAASPLPYAKALTILEGHRINENNLALAATGHKNQLFNRIKRIMEMKKNNINYGQLTIVLVAIIAITFTIAMFTFTPSFAQKVKKDASDTTGKKSSYSYSYSNSTDSNGKKKTTTKKSTIVTDDDDNAGTDVHVSMNDDDNDNNNTSSTISTTTSTTTSSDDDVDKMINQVMVTVTKSVADAMANIDMREVNKALKDAQVEIDAVDWDAIRAEIKKALAEVNKELDDEHLNKEISKEIKKSLELSKKQLEQAQRQIAESRGNKLKIQRDFIVVPDDNKVSTAHSSSHDYESMLKKMERDGLIDRSEHYKVKKEDGELFINGEKQSDAIYNRYLPYLKDKNVVIKGNKGTLTINVED